MGRNRSPSSLRDRASAAYPARTPADARVAGSCTHSAGRARSRPVLASSCAMPCARAAEAPTSLPAAAANAAAVAHANFVVPDRPHRVARMPLMSSERPPLTMTWPGDATSSSTWSSCCSCCRTRSPRSLRALHGCHVHLANNYTSAASPCLPPSSSSFPSASA